MNQIPSSHQQPLKSRLHVLLWTGLLLFGVAIAGLALAPSPESEGEKAMPASLGGRAYHVTVIDGEPRAIEVPTELPVLRFAGRSATGRWLAYTTLEALDESEPMGRRQVSREEAFGDKPELVPSGDLYVEDTKTHAIRRLDSEDHYVISVAWSPVQPGRLAYTFSSGAEFGLATANALTGRVTVQARQGVQADFLSWREEGLQYFERTGFVPAPDEGGFQIEQFKASTLRPSNVSTKMETVDHTDEDLVSIQKQKVSQAIVIRLEDGTTLLTDAVAGINNLEIKSDAGPESTTLPINGIEALSAEGIVVKGFNTQTGNQRLLYIGPGGQVTPVLATKATVSYYMPFQSGVSVAITQTGASYSTKCGISSHTGARAYAYDMQAPMSAYRGILAAASGTIAYVQRSITCNSTDTSGCNDYRSSCSSNSGFGNAVIIQHADGRWTSYAHLQYGSVKPSKTGVSVGRGCLLGTQGHTGATVGNVNGCGDHLHFQRQSGSSVTSQSVSIALAGYTNPLSCKTYTANNGGRSCIF